MKKRTLFFLAAAILVVVLAVPFALAQHMRGAGHRHGCMGGDSSMAMFGRMHRAQSALGLSDQQAAGIKKIFTDLRAQNEPYRASLRGGRQAIAQMLLANPNDIAGAQALIDKQSEAERQMKTNALLAYSKALNVMSSEQRTKAAGLLNDRLQDRLQDQLLNGTDK